MSIEEIIAALETATGPSGELDDAIHAVSRSSRGDNPKHIKGEWKTRRDGDFSINTYVLPFTASIDAALTLVPEGQSVRLGFGQEKATLPWCRVGSPSFGLDTTAATLALALCIAALRARQVKQ